MIKYDNSTINDWNFGNANIAKVFRNDALVYQKITPPTPTTPKWVATYTGGIITSAECNSDTSITVNEITKANLESVVIGNCVSAIVGECFSDCSKLSAATINGYTSIDNYSFARNNGTLKTIIMLSPTPPPCANTAFTYYNHGYVPMTSITIYVPAASVEAYKAASGWSIYADKIQAIS